jgi:uncharacterized protein
MKVDNLNAELAGLIGEPVSGRGRAVAPDPVNRPMIRHWVAAFEDENPVYSDDDVAASSRFGQIVAPPLMLQTWVMATPKITGIAERGGSPVEGTEVTALALMDGAGYTATLATNSEFEILRYLHVGDLVSAESVIESISDEKHTRIGSGRFVTWLTSYTDQNGDVVGSQRFRILKFRPAQAAEASANPARSDSAMAPAEPMPRSTQVDGLAGRGARRSSVEWRTLKEGDALPPWRLDLTATMIVAGAIASRDFMPVHHDRDYANRQGAPDIFMNILSDTGYCSRYLTDWAGPEAMIERLAIRLGLPATPGTSLLYTGNVTALSNASGSGTIEVAFRVTTGLGEHLSGTASLNVPVEGRR